MAIKLTNALKAALYGSVGHLEIMLIMYTLIQNKIIIFMFLKREICVYKLFGINSIGCRTFDICSLEFPNPMNDVSQQEFGENFFYIILNSVCIFPSASQF